MLTPVVQRWRARRDSYRPAAETIATHRYDVAPIDRETAKAFVIEHHYEARFCSWRFSFGLHRAGALVGAAVFSQPFPAALKALPGTERVELGRFVLLDDVPGNGESWFLARAFELLRGEVDSVLSFSDPMPRASVAGVEVFGGHIGNIYQAFNGVFLGQSRPHTIRLLPDGSVLSARAISKIRAGERGWRYAARLLVVHGATPLLRASDGRAWLAKWLPRLTRAVRHPGNLKYAWALDRRLRRHMPEGKRYPKLERLDSKWRIAA